MERKHPAPDCANDTGLPTERQIEYYKRIAEETGKRRLRDVEQLNTLIRQLRKSEEDLKRNEERFRLVAQSTSDIFYEWDLGRDTLEWFGGIDATDPVHVSRRS